ncbi:hydroxyacyl-thioester dehydratase type 2, mitochondrial-like [Saccostrea echinata]|uniref:hydroxyacyl-thioester dehydratase type 2, mitochondrial-like n=1 Tax=Saccostrea echinata TaxID=191078 RepID=UPI002A821428|nr:hydroxyacyl-thioester dehydratase type 2, mitochondrial-like [Saccostrea echinata]
MCASIFKSFCPRYSNYLIVGECARCLSTRKYTSVNVGDKASLTKTFTKDDVHSFAKLSLDNNPLHTDPDFAEKTKFGKCIVHGVLINGLISAVCSTKLPGPGAVYLSQEMKFVAPAFVGESVTAEVEVFEVRKSIMKCYTTAFRTENKQVLMQGVAKIMLLHTK